MSTTRSWLRQGRRLTLSVAGTAFVIVGLLILQHFRHGWPFSLHHGRSSETTIRSESSRPVAVPQAAVGHTQHPRSAVELDPARLGDIGIRLERARTEMISKPVRAVATVVPDESRVSHVHTRVAGWIERLYVNTTGQTVRAGQPLAGIFSQELLASQTEYLAALRQASTSPPSAVLEGARDRLKVFGMTDAEIREVEERKEPRRLVTVVAPRSGVVLHRGVTVGTAVDPSTEIVTVADLSRVWVLAEVPESEIRQVQKGLTATLAFPSMGGAPFVARVDFLYPSLTERTRTLRVRFAVNNPEGALRPGLYGTAEFQAAPRQAVTVSRDALVDTGLEQHVFVATAPGRFEPRTVKLGLRLADRVEIREGLVAGESVVSSGVFLIDSESRLRASGGAGTSHGGHGGQPSAAGNASRADSGQKGRGR